MGVPLTLTLAVEENAFEFFNALRKIYFPAGDDAMDAQLTLFHLLPNEPAVIEAVASISKQQKPIALQVKEPVHVDNGVAYTIESAELMQLHENLKELWFSFLIPQDQQALWPHITVQDKASPSETKELLQFLNENFGSFQVRAMALQLWESHNGQRRLFRQFDFAGN